MCFCAKKKHLWTPSEITIVGIATGLQPISLSIWKIQKYLFQDLFFFLSLPEDLLSSYESTLFNIIKRVKPSFVKSPSLQFVRLEQSREPPLLLTISKRLQAQGK